jgi:hypothetical protein
MNIHLFGRDVKDHSQNGASTAWTNRDSLFAKGTAWRLGPCDPGGVSPSTLIGLSRVTGSLFTGPGLPTIPSPRCGFFEPSNGIVGAPASSGSTRSLELTKAFSSAVPFAFSKISSRGRHD